MRWSTLALLLAVAAPAARTADLRLHGYAYDLESGTHLYTELHEQNIVDGKWIGGATTYIAADGGLIGKKTLDFSQDPFIPIFRLELKPGGGYIEGISALTADSVTLYRKRYGDKDVTEEKVARPEATTADSGFHNLMRDRFAELMQHGKVRFHFAVASELDTFKFRARRIADTTFEGKPAVRFLVEPDTLLRLLAAPLEMIYDAETRKLLEYRGISNIHDPATGEAYSVRIAYPSKAPPEFAKLPPEYR